MSRLDGRLTGSVKMEPRIERRSECQIVIAKESSALRSIENAKRRDQVFVMLESMKTQMPKDDIPEALKLTAANNKALLERALSIAQGKASEMDQIILDILSTGEIEGCCKLRPNHSTICFEANKFSRTWVMSFPWAALFETTPDDEADYILETIIRNLQMEETDSWPNRLVKKSERLI